MQEGREKNIVRTTYFKAQLGVNRYANEEITYATHLLAPKGALIAEADYTCSSKKVLYLIKHSCGYSTPFCAKTKQVRQYRTKINCNALPGQISRTKCLVFLIRD